MLQLVWNDSFAACATAAAKLLPFLSYRMPGFSNRTFSDRLEYPILFSISIQKNIYINTHIISYVYINRMIWAQENLAKFGYRSEMKVEKFRNGAIFWPHANNLKLSKYGYFTKKGKFKKLPKFITNSLPHERVLKIFFSTFIF
jgi:hypothetical protein